MNVKYYHNPSCSKSREALTLLQATGVVLDVHAYLEHGLAHDEVMCLAQLLELPVSALVRSSPEQEAVCGHLDRQDDAAWAQILVEHCHWLQRPIALLQTSAVIGRPPQLVLDWLVEQGYERS